MDETEPVVATYDLAISCLMEDKPELAEQVLRGLDSEALWLFFDRATKEQIARENLREMVVRLTP